MKYRLVIFDLDGTLLDTLEDLTDSVNYVLWKRGYAERTLEEVVGERVGIHRKPSPDSVNEVIHLLGVQRKKPCIACDFLVCGLLKNYGITGK